MSLGELTEQFGRDTLAAFKGRVNHLTFQFDTPRKPNYIEVWNRSVLLGKMEYSINYQSDRFGNLETTNWSVKFNHKHLGSSSEDSTCAINDAIETFMKHTKYAHIHQICKLQLQVESLLMDPRLRQ